MNGIYKTTPENPVHLSIGAVLVDENNKVACHYHKLINGFKDIYFLMRESIEPNESIEQTLERGLMEEFGATGEIIRYLGSKVANDKWFRESNNPTKVQKTTLYFEVKLISIDTSKRKQDDPESGSEIKFLDVDFLIPTMKEQSKRIKWEDIDESEMLEKLNK